MKQICYLFLYLNIYTCLFFEISAQEIQLSITAEKPLSEGLLDSIQFQNKFDDYLSLNREANEISDRFHRLGYTESELQLLKKNNDSSYTAQYLLGKRFSEIKIYYSQENFSQKELASVSAFITDTYFILPFETIESSLQKLNSSKTENGNAFASLRLSNISVEEDHTLSAFLILDLGSKRTIDSIAIKGYEKFPISYLKYFAGIKKGKIFSQKKLIKQNEAINSLPFVSTLKPPEALFRKDSTLVYFYLKKRNANSFDGVLGFATNEKTNKLQLNGYLNLELNNNLNFGEQFLLTYKADGEEQRNFRVNVKLPYLLKSPFGVGLELVLFKRDSTFITSEQQARITYQINPSSVSYVGYKGYESSNLLDDLIAGTPIEDYKSKFVLIGASYTKLQNSFLFPIKSEIGLDAEIGSRDRKETTDEQVKIKSIVNYIFNLNYKNSIFLQNNTATLLSDNFLINELYRFGGINSIRGFDENSIDASFYSVLNTEYRYQFNEGLYVHSIIDIGYFENKTLGIKEKLYGYGIGLGLQTKPGLLKINIANGNLENQTFKFSNTKIHLILSTRF